jgi:hypothetical protein
MLMCQPIEINKMKNKALVKSKKPRFINQGEMGGGGDQQHNPITHYSSPTKWKFQTYASTFSHIKPNKEIP